MNIFNNARKGKRLNYLEKVEENFVYAKHKEVDKDESLKVKRGSCKSLRMRNLGDDMVWLKHLCCYLDSPALKCVAIWRVLCSARFVVR